MRKTVKSKNALRNQKRNLKKKEKKGEEEGQVQKQGEIVNVFDTAQLSSSIYFFGWYAAVQSTIKKAR
jgi:type III secretory pathway component EscU